MCNAADHATIYLLCACTHTHCIDCGIVHSNSTVQVDLFVVVVVVVGGGGGVVVVACCDCSTLDLTLLLVLAYVHGGVVMAGCNLRGWSFPNCRGLTSYSKDSIPCIPSVALFFQPIGTHSRI